MWHSSVISDQRFSAPSPITCRRPSDGRLKGFNAWIPSTNIDNNDFLQIDLGSLYFICGVATQGNPTNDYWTKTYKIETSLDNDVWKFYSEGGSEKVHPFLWSNSEIIIVETLTNKGLCLPLSLEKPGFHMPKLLSSPFSPFHSLSFLFSHLHPSLIAPFFSSCLLLCSIFPLIATAFRPWSLTVYIGNVREISSKM